MRIDFFFGGKGQFDGHSVYLFSIPLLSSTHPNFTWSSLPPCLPFSVKWGLGALSFALRGRKRTVLSNTCLDPLSHNARSFILFHLFLFQVCCVSLCGKYDAGWPIATATAPMFSLRG